MDFESSLISDKFLRSKEISVPSVEHFSLESDIKYFVVAGNLLAYSRLIYSRVL